jgi:bacillithiol system protein YtxJ
MGFIALQSEEGLRQAIERSRGAPVVLFKHSSACSLSAYAYHELGRLTHPADPPVYVLVVQAERSLSNAVERRFGIRHQSPQVIVLYDGEPVYDASHGRVTAETVRRAAREAVSI